MKYLLKIAGIQSFDLESFPAFHVRVTGTRFVCTWRHVDIQSWVMMLTMASPGVSAALAIGHSDAGMVKARGSRSFVTW